MNQSLKLARLGDTLDAITAAGVSLRSLAGQTEGRAADEVEALCQELTRLGERVNRLIQRLERPYLG